MKLGDLSEVEAPEEFYPDMTEYTADGVPIVRTAEELTVEDEVGENALLSRIPLLSRSLNKARYLAWRSAGFAVREACDLTNVRQATVMHWRKNDPEFADIELNRLQELQRTVGADVLLLEFDRNFRLFLHADFKVAYKAACNPNSMSENELAIYNKARQHYRPKERIDLEEALKPEEERGVGELKLTVTVEGKVVKDRAAREEGMKKLLRQFQVNEEAIGLSDPSVVEGSFREVPSEV